MAHSSPMPVLTRDKRTEGEPIDRVKRRGHAGAGETPETVVEKMRGPKLVALWAALIALSWAVAGGIGYGAYRLVASLF